MTAVKFYLILSAILTLLSNQFFPLFRESYSFWAVPLVFLGLWLVLIILHILLFVLLILFTSIKKKHSLFAECVFRVMLRYTLPTVVWLARVKINAKGLEKLTDIKKILFVSNHQFDYDPIIIMSAFPDSVISFIGKKDIIEEMPFVAKAMSLLSGFFIDRENDREAAKTIVSAIKCLKESDRSIGLFPEGYCSKTGKIQPIRNGSLKIATKTKVPIAVCVLNNTRAIPKNMFRRKTVIPFKLVDVIMPETYENMTTAELGNVIHEKMETALKEMKNGKH
ncbi:MAG: 1-acyl-sn-glycerol-3-phosphate acyltransferase [Clostridia bacterium]|nr:1-acyl-sn-glycerol-3-phosphate acyltransferase [Clostridia bacterium]